MATLLFPLLIGLLAYALSTNGKVAELGRLAYFCGLLAIVLQLATKAVHLP